MKEISCSFTGHRVIEKDDYYKVMFLLQKIVEEKIKEGYKIFCSGGALGFDTLAAMTVLKLKETYPDIQLHLYLPCMDQAEKWPKDAQEKYEYIKQQANLISYAVQIHTPECMHQRNRSLIDKSSVCIAYCKQEKGGTAYTVNYAKEKNIPVINIADMIDNFEF